MPESLGAPFFTEHLRWLLPLLDEIQNTKGRKHENREKGNLKKKRNMLSCFNIYIVVFAFLSSTVDVGRW